MEILDFLNNRKGQSAATTNSAIDNTQEKNCTLEELTKQDSTMNEDKNEEPWRPQSTPNKIYRLRPDEVFVFGSNLHGYHRGGAARVAMNYFGAVWGQGVGLQGQSYAIPTMQGGVETIKPYVDEFIEFARQHKELYFYVTRIGCGIAGFKDSDIAPLFARALNMNNVILPASFTEELFYLFPEMSRPAQLRLHQHGQTRTLVDIAKALNAIHHFENINDFMEMFQKTICKYIERGTVSNDVCMAFRETIRQNGDKLLFGGKAYLDFDKLIDIIDNVKYCKRESQLDTIYSWREKTKLLRLAALLNQIKQYTDADCLVNDLMCIVTGRFCCGDTTMMNDTFRYPLSYFTHGIKEVWNEILKDGHMSNELLEEKIFTEHERRVKEYGLERVIEMDFRHGRGCHSDVYPPKHIGTAPVYTIDKSYNKHCTGFGILTKSCGDGIGPNQYDSLYEFRLVEPILCNECIAGEYDFRNGYYYPLKNYRKPVFMKDKGILRFDLKYDKIYFIDELMTEEQKNYAFKNNLFY